MRRTRAAAAQVAGFAGPHAGGRESRRSRVDSTSSIGSWPGRSGGERRARCSCCLRTRHLFAWMKRDA